MGSEEGQAGQMMEKVPVARAAHRTFSQAAATNCAWHQQGVWSVECAWRLPGFTQAPHLHVECGHRLDGGDGLGGHRIRVRQGGAVALLRACVEQRGAAGWCWRGAA